MLNAIDRSLRSSFKAFSGIHPVVDRMLTIPEWYYARSWITIATMIGSVRHDAPLDPMRVHYVDPQRIDRTVTWTSISANPKADEHPRFRCPHYRLAARVFDGDWDLTDARVTDSTVYRSFVAHFENGVPWGETSFYEEALAAIAEGGRPWSCSSRSDLDDRCQRIDELYDRIEREGYKTQHELYEEGDPGTSPRPTYRVIWCEIAVNVGRDGEFVFLDGRNRLAIAQILGLDEIPVTILVRHSRWQRLRNRAARGDLTPSDVPERIRTHPDVVDLF